MTKLLQFLFVIATLPMFAQHQCAQVKQPLAKGLLDHAKATSALLPNISHELKYDVKFVHLMLNLERTTKFVQGGVKTVATVTAAVMDTFMCLLHENHTIDSIRFNGNLVTATRVDSAVKIKPSLPIPNGQSFTVTIYYNGIPPIGAAAIGSGFSNATSGAWGNQVTWSLSEAIAAYQWWPCKQILTDKIDSSWVFVTTDPLNKVGSNGLLTATVSVPGPKTRYEWKNKKMIDYYLISVAVAKYVEYNQYAHPLYLGGDSIWIQNYIYDNAFISSSWINSQKIDLDQMPTVMNFLCKMYGMYPFYKQKYGHCMAPFGGGMEHQTMTSLGFFDYYVDAHELGHQWWGDNVTCAHWGDIWINEGFAAYTEHLVAQYLDPSNFSGNLNSAHNSVMSQPGGSCYFTGQDTLDANVIFDSRLTYDKGGSIIHTLRFVTNNDSLWFQTLRGFQNTYKNSTASVIDFKNYYQAQTSINATQFFNQWYYGEGYPTFNVTWNFNNGNAVILSTQSTSFPSSVPLFVTPMEYKILRSSAPDTVVRVMHTNQTEMYVFPVLGTVIGVQCDPNNWVINKVVGPTQNTSLTSTGEELSINSELVVSPNPSSGVFTIKNAKGSYFVTDINGKQVAKGNCEIQTMIDISKEANGIYILQINDVNGKTLDTRKLIKK
jgi:aminopeptidase N